MAASFSVALPSVWSWDEPGIPLMSLEDPDEPSNALWTSFINLFISIADRLLGAASITLESEDEIDAKCDEDDEGEGKL